MNAYKLLGLFIAALGGALLARSEKVSMTEFKALVSDALETVSHASETAVETVSDTAMAVKVSLFGTPYDALIESSARTYGLEPALLYKLLYAESRFRPDIIAGKVRSSTGALGIAQFMPATAVEELGSVEAALAPEKAIPGAARYLAKLIRSTGSVKAGVAAYNWGVGNVKRKGLAAAPAETVNYVSRITGENIKDNA